MQNILVPTDFSTKALNALIVACRLALKTGGTIHLIHVVEPLLQRYEGLKNVEDVLPADATDQLVQRLTAELDQLAEVHKKPGFAIDARVIVGDPFTEISKAASITQADIVLIGHKGHMDPSEFSLGSVTDKVIRSIECPVITVKEVLEDTGFKNIVYATDLTEYHASLAKLLRALQEVFGSTIHIVKVNTRKDVSNEDEIKFSMDKLAQEFGFDEYTRNVYSHEDEEYGIIYFADKRKADLIAMGVHEKSGFRRLISGGSLAEEVSDHTYRPVLTLRFDL